MMNSFFRSLILMFFCSLSWILLSVGIGELCPDGAVDCDQGLICDSGKTPAKCCDPIKNPKDCLCQKNQDCSNNYKCDLTTKKCVQCVGHEDCIQTGLCDLKNKKCVSCAKDKDCPVAQVGDRGVVHLKCKKSENKKVKRRCVECLDSCDCCKLTDAPCRRGYGDYCRKICSKNKCVDK